ncbi:tryptophan synthase beta chain 1 isoform X2 [Arabidopsis lyrata subsp. lyrata]|uniref:tryptophan synthase beta chain 1 isoform X2 n=1 Tax=Arabidopsis lyrata subsp. lyrata TaxID=81972 RepID=UPI000A29C438|nr:tryptophan synthase beta chain 1 isoform X2 [Arabidopsis lyrata subsp. lyrata]|eukprot:XP_020869930.1 tryptophan synthase beta chain 1 isoform X2 [Arabidopsis lyrata subsp. lyrata]
MSSGKIQVRGQPLPRVPARNHHMTHLLVCDVSTKRYHREINAISRNRSPSLDSVPTRTDKRQFLRGDGNGKFGRFGGKFVPETLMSRLIELEDEFNFVMSDHEFQEELTTSLRDYVGRETPLYFAERLTEHYKNIVPTIEGGPEIYLKREDLSHCGSHKINNALAQAMISRRLGCSRVVAATGAGQHGVATAAACAKLSLECTVFMGATDIEKQSFNVKSVEGTFKDASSEAIRNWVENLYTTYYLSGTVVGPHPYPIIVREFQSVIGKETRRQANQLWGGKPDVLVACVGSASNALGLFHEFVGDKDVRLVGIEAAGLGLDSGKHSATLAVGDVGVYHGSMSYLLQDDQGQILKPHSVGVGLEYPGVGPEISFMKETGRAEFYTATDEEAIQACMRLSRLEGIIPALEASHALAFLDKLVPTLRDGAKVVVNCSGRGDKDLDTLIQRGMPSSLC